MKLQSKWANGQKTNAALHLETRKYISALISAAKGENSSQAKCSGEKTLEIFTTGSFCLKMLMKKIQTVISKL